MFFVAFRSIFNVQKVFAIIYDLNIRYGFLIVSWFENHFGMQFAAELAWSYVYERMNV